MSKREEKIIKKIDKILEKKDKLIAKKNKIQMRKERNLKENFKSFVGKLKPFFINIGKPIKTFLVIVGSLIKALLANIYTTSKSHIKNLFFKKTKYRLRNLEYKVKRILELTGEEIGDLDNSGKIAGLTLFTPEEESKVGEISL